MLELQVKLNNTSIFKYEKTFTAAWRKKLTAMGFFFDKITDGSIGYKQVDCYISTNISFYVCEVKIIKKDIFKMNQLRDNQITALKRNDRTKCNSESIVCVYSQELDKYTIIPWRVIATLGRDDKVRLTFKDAM